MGSNPPDLTTITDTSIKSENVKIYPNPTKGELSISSEKNIESVRIFNFIGKELTNQIKIIGIKTPKVKLDLSSFPAGLFLLKTDNDKSIVVVE